MSLLLPELSDEKYSETLNSLRTFSKVVTAFSRQFIPYNKLRKENTLKVSHKGLTTQSIPYYFDDQLVFFEMELDFHLQSFWVKVGEDERQIPFAGISEMLFYEKVKELLNDLGFNLKVELATFTDENPNHLDPEILENFLKILHFAAYTLKLFRSELKEHTSSLQFRPKEMDLVMTIYGSALEKGRARKKNSKLLLGFSFGGEFITTPYFYCTSDPFPKYILDKVLTDGAYWSGEEDNAAILPYEYIKQEPIPQEKLIEFYQTMKNEFDCLSSKSK